MKTLIVIVGFILLIGCDQGGIVLDDPIVEPETPIEEPVIEDSDDEEVINVDFAQADIWMSIGQSNMQWQTNWATRLSDDNPNVQVRQFHMTPATSEPNIDDWTALNQVQSFAWVPGQFAQQLSAETDRPIRIIGLANGGTNLSCWTRKGACNTQHIQPVKDLDYAGVIWWQGESDALKGDTATYEQRLTEFFASLREDLNNPELPIIIVGLETYCAMFIDDVCTETLEWELIRAAQHRVAQADPLMRIVDISDLTNDIGEIHPTAHYDDIGTLLAEAAVSFIY